MEKQNVIANGKTPCHKKQASAPCDCTACTKTRLEKVSSATPTSIHDVEALAKQHKK